MLKLENEMLVWLAAAETRTVTFHEVFPYSLSSVVPGADPGVQAVSPQMTF